MIYEPHRETWDCEAECGYVKLAHYWTGIESLRIHTIDIDDGLWVDYSSDGLIYGYELLGSYDPTS